MAEIRVNPTRMELKKLQARYATARRGHKLLKDKRDELMKQFLEVVRENKALRERVEARLSGIYHSLSVANAVMSPKMLEEAMICPARQTELEVSYRNMMSVIVPQFRLTTVSGTQNEENGTEESYGMAFTSGELDASLAALQESLDDLILLAQMEKTAQLLAQEIEKTRRRVNALEYIMIPQYLATMKSIKMKLDENERGNTTRLMKVKDMMVEQQLANKHASEEDESEYGEIIEIPELSDPAPAIAPDKPKRSRKPKTEEAPTSAEAAPVASAEKPKRTRKPKATEPTATTSEETTPEVSAEKPKRTRKPKATEPTATASKEATPEVSAEKPKRTRKPKTDVGDTPK